jgi:hypothetical protein
MVDASSGGKEGDARDEVSPLPRVAQAFKGEGREEQTGIVGSVVQTRRDASATAPSSCDTC